MTRFYFDYNASSPIRPEVLDGMLPVMREAFGNPSSIHYHGQAAKRLLEGSRRKVASLLGCAPGEVVFVSGGSEGDNLAIQGGLKAAAPEGRRHIVTTAIEHPAVLATAAALREEGAEVTIVPVGASGIVAPEDIGRAVRADTAVVSVMHVNNETGTVQPVEEIGRLLNGRGILFHCDGVQAPGRIAVNVKTLGVDAYTISGHKLGGPKGAGALYVRKGAKLQKSVFGGRQERDRRAGTENVPGIVGLGLAADLCREEYPAESERLRALRDRLEQSLLHNLPETLRNGDGSRRAANTCSLRFGGVNGESMVIALDLKGFSVSSGAACSSGSVEPSHVLLAMGLSPEEARSSLRFSLGFGVTEAAVDALVEATIETVTRLRAVSPSYRAQQVEAR